MKKLKLYLVFLIILGLFVLPVSAYENVLFYRYEEESYIFNDLDNIINPNGYYENFKEELVNVNFLKQDVNYTWSKRDSTGSYYSFDVNELTDLNNETYNTTVYSMYSSDSYIYQNFYLSNYSIYGNNFPDKPSQFIFECLVISNADQFQITLQTYGKYCYKLISLSNFLGTGLDVRNETLYFRFSINTSPYEGRLFAKRLCNSSYTYDFGSLSIFSDSVDYAARLFAYKSAPYNYYLNISAINSNCNFLDNVGCSNTNQSSINSNFYNESILQLYDVMEYELQPYNLTYFSSEPNYLNISDYSGDPVNEFDDFDEYSYFKCIDNVSDTLYESFLYHSCNLTDIPIIIRFNELDNDTFGFIINLGAYSGGIQFGQYGEYPYFETDLYIYSNYSQTPPEVSFSNRNGYMFGYNSSHLFGYAKYTVQLEFSNDTSSYFINIPEFGVLIVNNTYSLNSSFYMVVNGWVDFAGFYNSTHTFREYRPYGYEYFVFNDTINYNSSSIMVDQFLYAELNYSINDSIHTTENHYIISTIISNDFAEQENQTIDNTLEIDNTTIINNVDMSVKLQIEYNISSYHYFNRINHTFNISIGVFMLFVGYELQDIPSIFELMLQYATPLLIFFIFPVVMKQNSKKWYFVLMGIIGGFWLLQLMDFISFLEMIILIFLTVVSFYVIKKKTNIMGVRQTNVE